MSTEEPICVLIGALGGQGGGLLTDWMVSAAVAAGYQAQSTSIPGVAQRTGATTYYFELYPQREPPAAPVFSLFADVDGVDLMVALEPAEAGRALSRGLVTSKTLVIVCTDRVYSVAEKTPAGDGRVEISAVTEALASRARKVISFANPLNSTLSLNGLMLGAICGTGVLPLDAAQFSRAIQERGIAVQANLTAFERGLTLASENGTPTAPEPVPVFAPVPSEFAASLDKFPRSLRALVGHALARLIDYQDRAYAELYQMRLERVLDVERATGGEVRGYALSHIVARRLATWMSYEDVPRVAQLKTRPGRIARIRTEVGAQPHEPLEIVDYLKPSRREFQDLLPAWLSWIVPKTAKLERGVPIHLHTTSPTGFAKLKMLAAMRRMRRATDRFKREQAAIENWLGAVVESAAKDYELACQVAELAMWARGYGKIRTRGLLEIERLTKDWSHRLGRDGAEAKTVLARSLFAARHDPHAACRPSA
jgi:indolepyruvate ferredoxin oxidoreductase beta subunit